MALLLAICLVAALAAVAPGFARARLRCGGVLLATLLGTAGIAMAAVAALAPGDVCFVYPWLPALGMTLSFRLDGLALLFSLLITGVGALVVVFAWRYLADRPQRGRCMALLLAFAASMLGLVLADDLLLLYVFWELTSVTSWLLIGFHHERAEARAASWQALLVTSAGGLALLAGFLLIALAAGTSRVSEIVASAPALASDSRLPWASGLVLAGILTKSAQFPVHGWLPRAMEAPTPVSAYLHAATMVKAGVYLALRLLPVLGALAPFRWGLLVAGGVSLLVGSGRALFESDLKRVLAYSTVSALGFLLLLTGVGTAAAVHGALAYLLAHGLYKGALFLTAGAVEHGAGTRDSDRLGGLWRVQPVTAAAAGLAALSMAGIPGGLGYVAKEAAYGGLTAAGGHLVAVAVVGNALFVVVAAVVGWRPFWSRSRAPHGAHDVPPALWAPPLALAAFGVAFGVAPATVDGLLRGSARELVAGSAAPLALFHGAVTATLSVATLALGVAIARYRGRVRAALGPVVARAASRDVFRTCLRALELAAKRHTTALQTGSLRRYLLVTFGVAAILLGAGFVRAGRSTTVMLAAPRLPEVVLGAIAVVAAVAAVRAHSRLAAITALGAVGYAIGLLFLLFGAPDLAMTQIAVETVTVMVFLLAFRHLPRFAVLSTRASKARDVGLASVVGALMALLVLSATSTQVGEPVSSYHLARSVSGAHGRNVVNTILVDFRGLDTLGETTVLAIAGFGIVALLKLRPRRTGA